MFALPTPFTGDKVDERSLISLLEFLGEKVHRFFLSDFCGDHFGTKTCSFAVCVCASILLAVRCLWMMPTTCACVFVNELFSGC